jgi:hypothetical protein
VVIEMEKDEEVELLLMMAMNLAVWNMEILFRVVKICFRRRSA